MDSETTFNLKEAITNGFIHEEVKQLKAVAKIKKQNMSTIAEKVKNFLGKKEDETIKNVVLTLEDGTQVESDSEEATPKVGDTITNEDGSSVADGEHTLQSGDVVVVEAGKVIEVRVKEEEITESEEMTALKAENEELKNKVEGFENSIKENNESIKNLTKESEESKELLKGMLETYNALKNSVSKEVNTKEVETKEQGLRSRVKTNK